ncbi:MAG: diacylglycerol kinase family protein [Candidatus Komeilibacteria bacterium]|nr:diacylglycerol kinase family protein [Candidatus Komeilibacteria bacterium]
MYLYIFDSFLQQKKYSKELMKIEHRLTDLELKGRQVKLSLLKNVREVIQQAIKDGVQTIVVVGNDQTFHQALNAIAGTNLTLGYIPFEKSSPVASVLHLPLASLACEVLAQRLLKKFDLGKINDHYFLLQAQALDPRITVDFGSYKITPSGKNQTIIYNHPPLDNSIRASSEDGFLEVVIDQTPSTFEKLLKKHSLPSVFPFKKVKLSSAEPIGLQLDHQALVKTPAVAEVVNQAIKIIVGAGLI